MPTIFTRIIDGELPARFVWKDDRCVAFLSNRPLRPGPHARRAAVRRSITGSTLDADLLAHLAQTAQAIGKAQMAGFNPDADRAHARRPRGAAPATSTSCRSAACMTSTSATRIPNPDPAMMDDAAATIRRELRGLGFAEAAGPD